MMKSKSVNDSPEKYQSDDEDVIEFEHEDDIKVIIKTLQADRESYME